MPQVVVNSLSVEDKERTLAKLYEDLAVDIDQGIEAIVVLTVVQSSPGVVDERLRSVFDLIDNEASIEILERWCLEARRLIQLHKSNPGGSA